MSGGTRRGDGQFAERLGMGLLLLVLALVMLIFGGVGAFLLDYSLHHRYDLPASRPGIELVIVPLSAVAAARWRFGAYRLISYRGSGVGPYLPLLMAATLVGLIAFLVWSWAATLTTVGPDEFGVVRWLGTALAAAFTIIWLPLFPRIMATLAGMIAGPALFGLVGYTLFASHMQIHSLGSDGPGSGAFVVGLVATPVWILGAGWLSQGGRPLFHAAWSGAVMLCLALLGTGQ